MPDWSEDRELVLGPKNDGNAYLEVTYSPPVGQGRVGFLQLDPDDEGPWDMKD